MRRWTATILVVAASLARAEDADRFQKLHELLLPHQDELAWTEVNWGTDLWEARRAAGGPRPPRILGPLTGRAACAGPRLDTDTVLVV